MRLLRKPRKTAAVSSAPPQEGAQKAGEEDGLVSFEEHAQNGRGIKRPAARAGEFLSSLAARSRALCAHNRAEVVAARYLESSARTPIFSAK
jgi:hypothetical protein